VSQFEILLVKSYVRNILPPVPSSAALFLGTVTSDPQTRSGNLSTRDTPKVTWGSSPQFFQKFFLGHRSSVTRHRSPVTRRAKKIFFLSAWVGGPVGPSGDPVYNLMPNDWKPMEGRTKVHLPPSSDPPSGSSDTSKKVLSENFFSLCVFFSWGCLGEVAC
jgi:hypothetical protein